MAPGADRPVYGRGVRRSRRPVGGYASPVAFDPDGRGLRLLTGQVVVDVEHTDPAATLTILLHELGHLVGLGHVADPSDTMHEKS